MRMIIARAIVGAVLAAGLAIAGGATAHAGPDVAESVSAAVVRADSGGASTPMANGWWAAECAYGHVCLHDPDRDVDPWWVVDGCFQQYVPWPYFESVKTHGNGVRVWYEDNRYDDLGQWGSRGLDWHNRIGEVWVYC